MSERYPGWVNGMDAQDARLATGTLVAPSTIGDGTQVQAQSGVRVGPGNPGEVSPGSGLSVQVNPFHGVIQDGSSAVGGAYLVTLDATKTVPLEPAEETTSRVDLVVAELVKQDEENPSGFVVRAVRGADGSQDPPATPPGAIALATVAVTAGAGQISASDITDTRPWTCAAGGILRIRDASDRPTVGLHAGLYVHNWAEGVLEMYDGSAWRRFVPEIDSGWRDLTVNSPAWLQRDGRPPPQIRRYGNMVFMRGFIVRNTADSTMRRATTVPAGFRPAFEHHWTSPVGGGNTNAHIILRSDGAVEHWALEENPAGEYFTLFTSWLLG